MKVAVVVFSLVMIVFVRPKPVGRERYRYALKWLAKAGWYPAQADQVDNLSEENVEKDLNKYLPAMQDFYRLKGDGVMNEETLETMSPRTCGNRDTSEIPQEEGSSESRRSKRYSYLGDVTWPQGGTVTFGFSNYLSQLPEADQITIAEGCARMWGDVSSLKFRLVDPNQEVANILITHEYIDGPGNTAGTGQSPMYFGRQTSELTLDNANTWRLRQLSDGIGTPYEDVFCHEMGHTLGLGHSSFREAVMYHTVNNLDRNTRLHDDDIDGIQSRYGPNTDGMSLVDSSTSTPQPDPPVSQPDPTGPTSDPSTPQPSPSVPPSDPSTPQTDSTVPTTGPSTPQLEPTVPPSDPSTPQPDPTISPSDPSTPQPSPSVPPSDPSTPQTDSTVPTTGPSTPQPDPTEPTTGPSTPQSNSTVSQPNPNFFRPGTGQPTTGGSYRTECTRSGCRIVFTANNNPRRVTTFNIPQQPSDGTRPQQRTRFSFSG